jgi:hypothetical protein
MGINVLKYPSGNHYYFCHFVDTASLPWTTHMRAHQKRVEVELGLVSVGADLWMKGEEKLGITRELRFWDVIWRYAG